MRVYIVLDVCFFSVFITVVFYVVDVDMFVQFFYVCVSISPSEVRFRFHFGDVDCL